MPCRIVGYVFHCTNEQRCTDPRFPLLQHNYDDMDSREVRNQLSIFLGLGEQRKASFLYEIL